MLLDYGTGRQIVYAMANPEKNPLVCAIDTSKEIWPPSSSSQLLEHAHWENEDLCLDKRACLSQAVLLSSEPGSFREPGAR